VTPATRPQALLRAVAGRTAVLLSTAALHLGRWATARDRADTAARAAHPSATLAPVVLLDRTRGA
jgi:hypothetical protein